jgi:hypothetical protein
LKAGSWWGGTEGVKHCGVKASSAHRTLRNKRKRQGKGASRKDNSNRAPCYSRGMGHGKGSVKAKAIRVLLDVEVGGFSELPPIVKRSFREGRYSPSIGMEMNEWQIMLEQFVAMGVDVKEEVINIDSD